MHMAVRSLHIEENEVERATLAALTVEWEPYDSGYCKTNELGLLSAD